MTVVFFSSVWRVWSGGDMDSLLALTMMRCICGWLEQFDSVVEAKGGPSGLVRVLDGERDRK